MSRVPQADSTANRLIGDAIGNKEDAAVGSVGTTASLMAYIKGILGIVSPGTPASVADADVTTNTLDSHVIGNKTDAAQTTVGTTRSIIAYVKGLLNQVAAVILLFAVPSADATTNANARDVLGNKEDAAVTTVGTTRSLMAYLKGVLGWLAAPSADATANTTAADVIGNKTDAAVSTVGTTKSLMGYLKGLIGFHTVPSADSTDNAQMRDVVGVKDDAAVQAVGTTKSAIGYLKGILDALMGSAGLVTWPAAAAPANGVSLAEGLRAIYTLLPPVTDVGETDIDDSAQDESAAWFPLITITPAAGAPLVGCKVVIDLDKATTGFATIESTATIQFRTARKVDGTNWRGGAPTTAVSGDNADTRSVEIDVGEVGEDEEARIEALMSADATADMELPRIVIYRALSAPTITDVAAA